eukprot:722872-Pyramimonas_sp.AAC.1
MTSSSHHTTRKFDSPVNSSRMSNVRVEHYQAPCVATGCPAGIFPIPSRDWLPCWNISRTLTVCRKRGL